MTEPRFPDLEAACEAAAREFDDFHGGSPPPLLMVLANGPHMRMAVSGGTPTAAYLRQLSAGLLDMADAFDDDPDKPESLEDQL